jgi:hypothetical protein
VWGHPLQPAVLPDLAPSPLDVVDLLRGPLWVGKTASDGLARADFRRRQSASTAKSGRTTARTPAADLGVALQYVPLPGSGLMVPLMVRFGQPLTARASEWLGPCFVLALSIAGNVAHVLDRMDPDLPRTLAGSLFGAARRSWLLTASTCTDVG